MQKIAQVKTNYSLTFFFLDFAASRAHNDGDNMK